MTELVHQPSHAQAVQFHTTVTADETPLQALLRESQLPDAVLIEAAGKGAVWIGLQRGKGRTRPRRCRVLTQPVSEGSEVILNYDENVLAKNPQAMQCIADHVNYSVWFKPSGMLCQGSKWSDHTVATSVAQSVCAKPCLLVHRLDKAACGLLLIAHTKNALRALTKMFEQRRVEKTYHAITKGQVTHSLPYRIDAPIDGKHAMTTIHAVHHDKTSNSSTLSLVIDTGRKHQIRRHLSQLGLPIVGDRLYGDWQESDASADDKTILNLQLVASRLGLTCPFTGNDVQISIDAQAALRAELTV